MNGVKNFFDVDEDVDPKDVQEVFSVTLTLRTYDVEGNLLKEGETIERRIGCPGPLKNWYMVHWKDFETMAKAMMAWAVRKFFDVKDMRPWNMGERND